MIVVSCLVHYNTLLQITTAIIKKSDNYFIAKWDKNLLQNASVCLLQSATVFLQNVTVITK